MLTLAYPHIDPVAIEIGPLAIRWYALSYVAGILFAWRYIRWLGQRVPGGPDKSATDDFILWATLGIIFGGRLGYVLFYKPGFYLENPLQLLALWQGGMSFHGGVVGVVTVIFLFSWRRGYDWRVIGDLACCATPWGLFFGRIANFINGELYGRVTDSLLGMVFPGAGPLPRHPSQLYEAVLEGLVLSLLLLWLATRTRLLLQGGCLAGVFLTGYGIARIFSEFFREPDAHIGFLAVGTTLGQWLSLPLIVAGIWLIVSSRRHVSA